MILESKYGVKLIGSRHANRATVQEVVPQKDSLKVLNFITFH